MRILLISELSRLGRNVDEVLKNVMLCKERGLNVYFQKENLSIFDEQGKEHSFLTIFIAILGTVAQMERDNIKFRLDSGREMYKRSGGKLGRKSGYRKSKEQKQEQYAGVIKLLKKGYLVSQYCQDLRCQNLNCYEIEERIYKSRGHNVLTKTQRFMPNWCDTTYKCVGNPKEVRALHKVFYCFHEFKVIDD